MNPPPKFIVVDGPDGVGKTTLICGLAKKMLEEGMPVVPARNPAGTRLGAAVRKASIEVLPHEEPTNLAQFYAQVASTTQLVKEQLMPNIDHGFVIFDRYLLSTIVYQGLMPRVYMREFVPRFYNSTAHLPQPGFTVVLNADPATILKRIADRNGPPVSKKGLKKSTTAPVQDIMETSERIHALVAGFNQTLAWIEPNTNFLMLPTTDKTEEEVLDIVWDAVRRIWPMFLERGPTGSLEQSREAVNNFG